ncbi:4'-phosphopantetheinyl transferase superfamily protein [Pseudoalteromonas sp. OFAV1]|uniref:4'-phosphopantetheinyl transferase family protein n=1 Tax=Pseudoalteromonas sp. OFAV1 TaxID=2908892 RepID=UPI001F3F6962|nr:4'-phosphopantetheinyl transferase superfamily protein [Pseudoalteromonas sp. OFAV1]MCF2902077.1 4'-phosphopantetheinyl transferase superfamily protein [Pseudoalteromonas sp. OFAV1]
MFIKKSKFSSQKIAISFLKFDNNYYDSKLFYDEGVILPDTIVQSVPDRQAEFLAGRICAKKCLNIKSELANQVLIGINREPIWPNGVFGSISHSGDLAVSVVNNDFSVGIDIESIIDKKVSTDIQDIVSTKDEVELFKDTLSEDHSISIIFSMKEAIYKCLYPYVKKFFDFKDASIKSVMLVNKGEGFLTYELSAAINTNLSESVKIGNCMKCIVTITKKNLISLCVQSSSFSKCIKEELILHSETLKDLS